MMKYTRIFFLLAALIPLFAFAQDAPAPAPTVAELEAQLTNSDAHLAQAARLTLERVPGAEADQALIRALDKTSGDALAGVVTSLGNRKLAAASAKIQALVSNSDKTVAISAIGALGNLGETQAVKQLQNAQKDAGLAPHATEALLKIAESAALAGKKDVARSIYEPMLADAQAEAYWLGVRGFLRFDAPRVLPDLEKLISGENDATANRAISLLYDVSDNPFLAKMADLCAALPEARQLFLLEVFANKEIFSNPPDARILPGVKKALEATENPEVMIAAVTVLGRFGSQNDLIGIVRALNTDNASVQRAAEAALMRLNVADLPQTLLKIIEDANEKISVRISAIRVLTFRKMSDPQKLYASLEKLYDTSEDEALREAAFAGMTALAPFFEKPAEVYTRLLAKAPNVDRQKQILNTMSGSWATFEAIDFALEIMRTKPEIRPNAGLAVVHIANRLRNADAERVAVALKTVLQNVQHEDVEKRARTVLAEINKLAGFMLTWSFNGPYTKENVGGRELHDMPFGPEKDGKIDVDSVMWRPLNRGRDGWKWNLEAAIQNLNNGVAYLRCYVWSPAEQEVLFYGGVDDGMKIWLNGEQILDKFTSAPVSLGQCEVRAKLRSGWNEVVLKLTDATGEWEFGLRLCAPDQELLDGLKYQREK